MTTTWVQLQLEHIECYECHVIFGMTTEHKNRCQGYRKTFYCPNGHGQVYRESDVEKLEKKLLAAEQECDLTRSSRDHWRSAHEQKARSLAATKGVVTKIKRRVGKGVCPCCNRNFKDLRSHMEGQHPDWSEDQ